jgi:protein phosphatase
MMRRTQPRVVSADTAPPTLAVAAFSTKGQRDENQDWLSWTRCSRGELFVVADGMGGYRGGARAARMTVDAVEAFLAQAPKEWPLDRALAEAIRKANEEVHRAAQSGDAETQHMGSTVVVALVADGKAHIGHVGDSRAYLYRRGRLQRLTRDHTRLQQMLDARVLTPRQARNHPDGSVLSRAIGRRPDVEVEIAPPLTLKDGDALLFCSDGLSGVVKDDRIRKALARQPDVQRIPGDLADLALAAGSSDNITVQFVRVGSRRHNRFVARFPTLAGAAAGSIAVALGLALLTTRSESTRSIAPGNVSEDTRSSTGTPATPAALSRPVAPAVTAAVGSPPVKPAPSQTPTPQAAAPTGAPPSIVSPPAVQRQETAPAAPVEPVPANERTQRPAGDPAQAPAGDRPQTAAGDQPQAPTGDAPQTPTGAAPQTPAGDRPQAPPGDAPQAPTGDPAPPPPSNLPAPEPPAEPVVPESGSDDPPQAARAAPAHVVSERHQDRMADSSYDSAADWRFVALVRLTGRRTT